MLSQPLDSLDSDLDDHVPLRQVLHKKKIISSDEEDWKNKGVLNLAPVIRKGKGILCSIENGEKWYDEKITCTVMCVCTENYLCKHDIKIKNDTHILCCLI